MKICVSCIDAGLGLFLSPLLSTINKLTHFQISKGCLDSSSKSSCKSNLSSPQPTFSGFMCAAGITALLKKMDYRWCLTYDDLDVGEGHFDFFTKKNKKRDPDKNKNGRDVVVAVDGSLFRHHPHFHNVLKSRVAQVLYSNLQMCQSSHNFLTQSYQLSVDQEHNQSYPQLMGSSYKFDLILSEDGSGCKKIVYWI